MLDACVTEIAAQRQDRANARLLGVSFFIYTTTASGRRTFTERIDAATASLTAGRWRLTFRHAGRACRFTVDEAGTILSASRFPVRARSPHGFHFAFTLAWRSHVGLTRGNTR